MNGSTVRAIAFMEGMHGRRADRGIPIEPGDDEAVRLGGRCRYGRQTGMP